MNIEIQKSKVYVLLDGQKRITRIEGEYSLPQDLTGWLKIDEGNGDKFSLAQSHYLEGGLRTQDGILRWKYEDGACLLRSEEEVAADRAAMPKPQPSQLDRVEAQIMYTALVTDSLIEEDA